MSTWQTPSQGPVDGVERTLRWGLVVIVALVVLAVLFVPPPAATSSAEWKPGVTCPRTAHGCATNAEIAAVKRAIARRFGTGWKGRIARCVGYVESGFNPFATNGRDRHSDGSVGSFGWPQIGALHRARGESVAAFRRRMYDPVQAAEQAWRLSERGTDFSPWTGSRSCWS